MLDAEAYEQFRATVRRLADERVAPHAAEVDRSRSLPEESIKAFRDANLIGLPFPEEFGGQGGDLMTQVIAVEEIARVCATSALSLFTSWIVLDPLVRFGSPMLVEEIVRPVSSGEQVAAWCLTEPAGGSDLAGIKTRAEQAGDGWMLNGTKRFITNATWADWYMVLARTGEGRQFGIFAVHRDDPGISFGARERKMGVRGSPTADVILENCRISADRVVGDPFKGYEYMNVGLTNSRAVIAAEALGIAQGALDEAVRYTKGRQQFGQTISRFQMIRGMVADMAVKVESSRALLYRAVNLIETDPGQARAFASMAKLLCSDTAMAVTTDAVQLHGGYGYLEDYPVERMMRDAKITQIYEGTNQIQRLIIAKHVYQD
ncbi:acyl-CoA dehydrogenase family protein [Bosea sp. (in: a-proteobacteria)]|uniref:acyl-CoA dehydrogenase family protein n=1 Tax=Bosea sp. (in: a-proteobacteria) TaxID=1871050 RepID=UPI00260B3478|nr:acyl-CoA dehydrogenase family protein [Bosea sp. (in: a-proteobacteria)]MCO5089750.1 acyl-CoA dehydrogenase family protein [Bosea sp. (in: a-proteobacteria)]